MKAFISSRQVQIKASNALYALRDLGRSRPGVLQVGQGAGLKMACSAGQVKTVPAHRTTLHCYN